MKKLNLMLALAILMPAFFVSAQQNPLKNRVKQTAKSKIDFSKEPTVAPSEEFDVSEFQLKRKDLQGKVVELTFDRVHDLKQTGQGYSARVTFENGRTGEGIVLLIPEEGLELFEEMAERDSRSPLRETVYVEVIGANMSRVVGTRYSKTKPEGERYSW